MMTVSSRCRRAAFFHAAGAWVTLIATSLAVEAQPLETVDYNRDVRPILADNCFACHGPDAAERKAGLRLDTAEGLAAVLEGDIKLIEPGHPDDSELIFRVEIDDPSVRMPPPEAAKSPLTADQVSILRQWVEQGGAWSNHWAFVAPIQPDPPVVREENWSRSPIDRFILARLEAKGLSPAPEADKVTLIRRLSLDLTGLPPTPREVDAYLADDSPEAYERLVDRLLDSPRFGEHMARYWLDLARYGDTHGLHLDNYREIWPYRDWVIQAFIRNLPFDQFLTEQLAGDMLPEATLSQKIASGFNRAHVSTSEGGSIVEEVDVRNVTDRVDTTGTVFLGLSTGCARCHDHKYDPISQKEYYSLYAIFNSLDDNPMDGNAKAWAPIAQVPTPEQESQMATIQQRLSGVRETIAAELARAVEAYDTQRDADQGEYVRREDYPWIEDALPPGAKASGEGDWRFVSAPDHPVFAGERAHRRTSDGQGQHHFTEAAEKLRVGEGDSLFAHVWLDPTNPPKEIMLQWRVGDWKHRAYWGENLIEFGQDATTERVRIGDLPRTGEWVRLEVPADRVGLSVGTLIDGWAFTQYDGTVYWDQAGITTWTPQEGQAAFASLSAYVRHLRAAEAAGVDLGVPKDLIEIVKLDRDARDATQKDRLLRRFIEHADAETRPVFDPLHRQLAEVEGERKALDEKIPTTLVSKERDEPKTAFLLDRGEYDRPKDPVGRGTPGFLPPPPRENPSRLDFARWLVDPEHPLTARVAVNRFWLLLFGTGLVKTAEDFGLQGEPPTHPELLDWLAVTFREDGWDIKGLTKQLVMSATYRQSSRVTPEKLAKDPANRLLSRGPRFRLDAETIRDQALFVSGLLVEHVGGPSVKPPQPSGLWEAVGYTSSNTAKFQADTGRDKVHRRSLYTFWKRTSAPPQMTTFDAPSREACTVRRERTNTPLQALMLMNEPQMVEASRVLAERALHDDGSTTEARIITLFRRATARPPEPDELAELTAAYHDFLAEYRANVEAAKALIAIGETPPDPALDPAELAATTMLANIVLNLDEVITKE